MHFRYKINSFLNNKIKAAVREILTEKQHNIKDGLQQLALQETCLWIQDNVPLSLMYEDRFELLSASIEKIQLENGLILEFGVYKGGTINHIAKSLPNKIIYGFDSFEGLKEPWIFNKKGSFSDSKGRLPKVLANVKLVKGNFSDTLSDFLTTQPDKPISFIHIDSDLYSSAKTIFEKVDHLIIEGTVLVFDEFFNYPNWKNGEYKAWTEFMVKNKISIEYIGFTYQKNAYKKSGNQLAFRVTSRD